MPLVANIDNNKVSFSCRYKLNFTAADTSGEGRFFAFDAMAQKIIKKECQAVFNSAIGLSTTPPALTAIIGTQWTFAIGLTDECYHNKDIKIFLVNFIVRDFQRPPPAPVPLPVQLVPATPHRQLALPPPASITLNTPSSSSALANQTPIQTSASSETNVSESHHTDDLLTPASAISISDQVTRFFP